MNVTYNYDNYDNNVYENNVYENNVYDVILEDIIEPDIINEDNISHEEYYSILETIGNLIYDLIYHEPMILSCENCNTIIYDEIYNLLSCTSNEDIIYDDDLYESIIDKALNIYNNYINPPRSYNKTFIRKGIKNNHNIEKKIKILKNIPQPEQRTDEWYKFRHNILTASSIWKIFGSDSSRNNLIYDKCTPINTDKYNSVSTDSSLHWGQKYEPISVQWYENKYNTQISDFGCIKHFTYDFIGASPDGINTDINSRRYGRMLEIKNIVNREITGIPKTEYWIQMQLQLEVCDLNECDFLETQFIEYEDENNFEKDGCFNYTSDGKIKGIFILFIKDGFPHYEYPPFLISKEEFTKWENDIMSKNNELTWVKNIYWKLDKVSCILVLRNKYWFKNAVPYIIEFKNIIEDEKINGFKHREPKKRINKHNNTEFFCKIDTESLM